MGVKDYYVGVARLFADLRVRESVVIAGIGLMRQYSVHVHRAALRFCGFDATTTIILPSKLVFVKKREWLPSFY